MKTPPAAAVTSAVENVGKSAGIQVAGPTTAAAVVIHLLQNFKVLGECHVARGVETLPQRDQIKMTPAVTFSDVIKPDLQLLHG